MCVHTKLGNILNYKVKGKSWALRIASSGLLYTSAYIFTNVVNILSELLTR